MFLLSASFISFPLALACLLSSASSYESKRSGAPLLYPYLFFVSEPFLCTAITLIVGTLPPSLLPNSD